MQQFLHYERLSDWENEDGVVVVHILDQHSARVRTHTPNIQSDPMAVEQAFDEAAKTLCEYPYITRIGVYLDEDAKWFPAWGELKPAI